MTLNLGKFVKLRTQFYIQILRSGSMADPQNEPPRYSADPPNEQNSMWKSHHLSSSFSWGFPEIPIWRAAWLPPLKNFPASEGRVKPGPAQTIPRLSEGKRREILEILCQALVYLHDQARSGDGTDSGGKGPLIRPFDWRRYVWKQSIVWEHTQDFGIGERSDSYLKILRLRYFSTMKVHRLSLFLSGLSGLNTIFKFNDRIMVEVDLSDPVSLHLCWHHATPQMTTHQPVAVRPLSNPYLKQTLNKENIWLLWKGCVFSWT